MKVYFVTAGKREEMQVIKQVLPPRILCSYWYFKNMPLSKLCEQIGYRPEIMLDSGAYSAHKKGTLLDVSAYMDYIKANERYISRYVTMDVIGDGQTTRKFYEQMQQCGFSPIPVIHYGADISEDLAWYVNRGVKLIALGGTVGVRDKREVVAWCIKVKEMYPECKFHLLGSSSTKILQCGALDSCDASTWYMAAVNGKPLSIPGRNKEAKIARAEENMRRIMEEFNEMPVSNTNRII